MVRMDTEANTLGRISSTHAHLESLKVSSRLMITQDVKGAMERLANLVKIGLQLHILQALLEERNHGPGWHIVAADAAFVHKALVSKHECRMGET